MTAKRQMFRSSVVVGIFSLLGSLTGILVEVSIAAKLGLSLRSDTFYVAFTVPYIITNLISATGQFSLVPFFSSLEAGHSEEEVWRGLSYAANLVFIGLMAVAGLGAAAAPGIIRVIAPGFIPAQTHLAAHLARWLFIIIIPAGVAETIRSFLLSRHRFAIPSSASFFRNVTVVASVVLGFRRYGFYSIIFGYLAGYLFQLGVLAMQLFVCFPVQYRFSLAGSNEAIRKLHGAGMAQLATSLGWQALAIVERIIASFLPPGSLTALAYGMKIMSTIAELLAGSVGTAALPTLAKAVVRRAHREVSQALSDTLEIGLTSLAPTLVFCLVLDRQIVRLVFQRGNFTPESTLLMAEVFFYYSLGLLPFAAMRLMNFYLFARNEVSTFFRIAIFQYALNVGFDLIYVGILHMDAKGIPLGMLTALTVTCGLIYARNVGAIKETLSRELGIFASKASGATALAALGTWGIRTWIAPPATGLGNFVYLTVICGAGTLIFLGAMGVSGAFSLSRITVLWRRPEGS